jgi:hypothetical protein
MVRLWSLLAGLVRAVPVVVAGVLAKDGLQVPFAIDEHPVGALATCAAYPPFSETVCAASAVGSSLSPRPRWRRSRRSWR